MKCEDAKLLFMDFLYDEISTKDAAELKAHLAECEGCRLELQSLKQTSQIMKHAEDVDPKLHLTFVSETRSIWDGLRARIRPLKIGYGLAIGFASVLLVLSIINAEINYRDGDFSLKMSLMPRQAAPQTEAIYDQEQRITELQQQNLQLMNTLLQQSEQRQRRELINALAQFSQDFDNRRSADLQIVGVGLDEIEKSLYSKLTRRTNSQFNELIRYIDAKQGVNK